MVVWLLFSSWAMAATVTASVDRNPVALGDPVTLTFSADGVVAGEPDFAPLQQDFEIRGRSQSNSFSMVNGVSSVRTEWTLHLYPGKSGTLTVPAIAFGADHSQPLQLQVLDQPPPTAAGGTSPDIIVELAVEPKQPFVQQQTLITQRLLHIGPLQQASLSPPEVEAGKGTIQKLGNETRTSIMRNGRNYQVVELHYALIPQQSGELTLGRTAFEGVIDDPGSNALDPFGLSGDRVRRFSTPVSLQVQAQPATYTGKQWLPARSVTLNAHWQRPPDMLKAGEPDTLTLAVVADGLAAEQLPALDVQMPAEVKAYTDKPELRNDASNSGVIGVRQEKWVVVAANDGTFELPKITLDWWNTTTGKQETAVLDAVKLQVVGGQTAAAPQQPATKPVPSPASSDPQAAQAPAVTITGWPVWEWIVAGLLVAWIALSLGWIARQWWLKYQSGTVKPSQKAAPVVDAKVLWQRFEQACQQNQPQAAHDALVRWIDVGLDIHPALLTRLWEQADPVLQAEIDRLNGVLYGRGGASWNGTVLLSAMKSFKPATLQQTKASGLAELYPD
jgi:hypothetical protein